MADGNAKWINFRWPAYNAQVLSSSVKNPALSSLIFSGYEDTRWPHRRYAPESDQLRVESVIRIVGIGDQLRPESVIRIVGIRSKTLGMGQPGGHRHLVPAL